MLSFKEELTDIILTILHDKWITTAEVRSKILKIGVSKNWALTNQRVAGILAIMKRQGIIEKIEKGGHRNYWRLSLEESN